LGVKIQEFEGQNSRVLNIALGKPQIGEQIKDALKTIIDELFYSYSRLYAKINTLLFVLTFGN
jgi:hypothetical protein